MRRAQAVEVGARLAAELDDVLEALGGDEHRARALALEQRVGGDGRAVGERLDLLRREAPARSSAASTAASTPSDWSSGVVGALAVTSRPPTASTASVKVPPTSTPSSIGRGRYDRRAADAPLCGERDLLGLGQVLVRRAVAVVRQRHALAGRAAARRRAALEPVAVEVVAAGRLRREPLAAKVR